jgi:acyl dehydratase
LSQPYNVELATLPSLFSLYRKIFFGRKPGWDQQPLPNIMVKVQEADLVQDKLEQYAKVCGFTFDGKQLPPTYLYVLAFRLHAVIFTHDAVTFPLLGMIHLKNSIQVFRPVVVEEKLSLECELKSSELTDTGLEFELVSKAYVGDELVWQALSTYLYRIDTPGRRARPPRATDMSWDGAVTWALSEDLGRQYAKASGDYNLIHLHPLLSKRFGFERVLAHGMWSKARCIAQMMPTIGQRPFSIDVEFKLPVFMPSDVTFNSDVQDKGLRFEVRDLKGRRPHLQGQLAYLD